MPGSQNYLRLSKMDTKELERALSEMDFASRYEEKMKNFMDTELVQRMNKHLQKLSNPKALYSAICEVYDYFSKTLLLFYPLISGSSDKTEQSRDARAKRKPEFKEKLFTEFRLTFMNHLRYCILDSIDYDSHFTKLIR